MHQHVAGNVFEGYNPPFPALVDVEGVEGDAIVNLGVQIKPKLDFLVPYVPGLPIWDRN